MIESIRKLTSEPFNSLKAVQALYQLSNSSGLPSSSYEQERWFKDFFDYVQKNTNNFYPDHLAGIIYYTQKIKYFPLPLWRLFEMKVSRTLILSSMQNTSIVKLSEAFADIPVKVDFQQIYMQMEHELLRRLADNSQISISEIAVSLESFASMNQGSPALYKMFDQKINKIDLSGTEDCCKILWGFCYVNYKAKSIHKLRECISDQPTDLRCRWSLLASEALTR